MKLFCKILLIGLPLLAVACSSGSGADEKPKTPLVLEAVLLDGVVADATALAAVNPSAVIELRFSTSLDATTISPNLRFWRGTTSQSAEFVYDNDRTVKVVPASELTGYTQYNVTVQPYLRSAEGVQISTGRSIDFTTSIDNSDKFDRISDDELMTLIQRRAFNYFWNFAHPDCGMARERSTSGNTVTTGGSGFGFMAIIAGVERGFVTRAEAVTRMLAVTDFLENRADRFHGAYSHWLNGATGKVQAFSTYDDGADLIETSFLMEGLLAVRAYFDGSDSAESALRSSITRIWESVEWDWFTKDGAEQALYWHWSPIHEWRMNMKISGWNEGLMAYVLAAASPTHSIAKSVYDAGWAGGGAMRNGKTFYNTLLPLGPDYGGPMFFAHYSFMGLNPNGLSDVYCSSYAEQNRAHAAINYAYCVANPKAYGGYSSECWGLTASDEKGGYSAHSPSNDNGTIAPTAALASMPYTPEESKAAMRYFYYKLGDKLWGEYGFFDAFNLSQSWFATDTYIAIDQGPIAVMIENYRSGAVWNAFMKDADVTAGLTKLGFTVTK